MDLTKTIEPRSDQLNADDLMASPRTVTIVSVRQGNPDQPVDIITEEFGPGRPFKPCKSMRRVLVSAWGPDATVYAGRRMTLYRDPSIRFGKDEVGGIRISHLSHIEKSMALALTVTRGKRAAFRVDPLPDAPPMTQPVEPSAADVAACTDTEQLRAMWQVSGEQRRAQIQARVAELQATPAGDRVPDDGTPEPHDNLLSGADQ